MIALVIAALVFVSAPDGDTLTVRDSSTNVKTVLRLTEIDAPERTQPYSQVSRRNLVALCQNKPVEFTPVNVDRYGRTVAMVTCDGVVVNWRQVQDGLAWCFTKYLTQPSLCLPLEREAMNARRGLWRDACRLRLGNFELRRYSQSCRKAPEPLPTPRAFNCTLRFVFLGDAYMGPVREAGPQCDAFRVGAFNSSALIGT